MGAGHRGRPEPVWSLLVARRVALQRGLGATGNLRDPARTSRSARPTQRLDLRLAWTSTSDKYGLAAYVTNVLDDQYVTGVNNITTDTFGTPFALISQPRMWGVEATVAF